MDEFPVMALVRDVETVMKIMAIALKEGSTPLALEALTNAETELATIRRILEELPTHESKP